MNRIKLLSATDLHQAKSLYEDLHRAVDAHRPDFVALVGDILNIGERKRGISVTDCAVQLAALPCPQLVMVRGNHEEDNWMQFAQAWPHKRKPLATLHEECFQHGPLVVAGFPCLLGDEEWFADYRPPSSWDAHTWLRGMAKIHGPAMRCLWLMHEPPSGTNLTPAEGPTSGNIEWREAIESYQPWLVLSGHEHKTPILKKIWYEKVGETICINAGQSWDGPLRYCVVDMEFRSEKASLPNKMSVTRYPDPETLIVR